MEAVGINTQNQTLCKQREHKFEVEYSGSH